MNKKSVLQTGFRTVSKKTYYFDPRTYKALTGSHEIGGELYIFTSKGVMRTGLQTLSSGTYYLGSDGKARTLWQTVGTSTYYFDPDTRTAVSGTKRIGGNYYHFSSAGVLYTGFHKKSGRLYYSNAKGVLTTQAGLKTIKKKTYLFEAGGICLQERRHLINKRTCSASTNTIHTLLRSITEIGYLCILAPQLHNRIRMWY